MSDRIDARAPSGFRDYLPADALARQSMMDRIKTVFEQFSFVPIDTPALEREEVLTGGDAGFSKQLYRARITEDDEPLGLRFDLTVPLARFVSAHADDLQFPFLRYHIGNVWRGEHAQAGRFRQFIQADADIVGATSSTADAQILALVTETLDALGLDSAYTLRISNRNILEGLVTFLGLDASQAPAVLRAIDKRDKLGWDAVARELTDKVGLDAQQADGIQEFLALKGDTPEQLLDAAEAMLKFSDASARGIAQLRESIRNLDAMDVPRTTWVLDLSIARGLGYYTGTVFETTLNALPQYGSICSGGRYDGLVARFSPLQLTGVGMSIGLDRLFAALDELGLIPTITATARVAVLDFEPTAHDRVLALVAELRRAGISTALYLGGDSSLKAQLAWAVKAGYPAVVLMGASELERGVVQLKHMQERTQEEVPVGQVTEKLSM